MEELKLLALVVRSRPYLEQYLRTLKILSLNEEGPNPRVSEVDNLLRQYDSVLYGKGPATGTETGVK